MCQSWERTIVQNFKCRRVAMKKITLTAFVAFAFFVAAAVAQTRTTPGGSQGTTGSSPSTSQPGYPGGQQPGMSQPDSSTQSGQMGQTDQSNTGMNSSEKGAKGEKKIKGCVQSQGGQYVLETKKGKAIALTGQDVSAHVGHEVAVKGTWETGSAGSSAAASSGGSEKMFNVASVDMISSSCSGKTKGSSGMNNSGGMGRSEEHTS